MSGAKVPEFIPDSCEYSWRSSPSGPEVETHSPSGEGSLQLSLSRPRLLLFAFRASNDADPESVIQARRTEADVIAQWVKVERTRLRAQITKQ